MILSLLAACGGRDAPVITCSVPCHGECGDADRATAIVARLLVRHLDTGCELLDTLKLVVEPGLEVNGYFQAGDYEHEIHLRRDLTAYAHEVLHAYEYSRGELDFSDPHRGWSANATYGSFIYGYLEAY